MKYSAYPEYKTSEMNWINEIPIHWQLRKLRFIVSENFANGIFKKSTFWGSGRKVINVTDVYTIDDLVNQENLDRLECSDEEYEKYSVKHGDFFLVRSSLKLEGVGKSASILDPEEETVFECHLVRGRPDLTLVDSRFLSYTLNSKYCRNYFVSIANVVTMATIDQEKFKSINLPLPFLDEQVKIADFLDHKTAQIDLLIEKKRALIEKLNEKRIALITQAVTKGLNPDEPMKLSGVDWLGDVPAHWDVRRLRFAIQSNPVKSQINDLVCNDMVSFVPMDAVGEYGGIRLDVEKPLEEVYDGYTYFRDNDVVIAKITPCFENGKGAIAEGLTNGVAFGTTELHVMRPLEGYSSRWLFYLSICHSFREIGASEMYGAGGQKRVPESFIKDFRIGIPGFDEQESIADFIDSEVKKMDEMLRVNNQTIERLTEYRTALITAAVTGKIDVSSIEVPDEEAA